MDNRQNSVNINWYPGHMAKTKRQIQEDLKLIDVVIELLDARIPMASRNPDIEEMIKGKKRIILLNKSDLAEEGETKKWASYFEKKGIPAVITDANSGVGMQNSIKTIENMMKEEKEIYAQKGRVGRTTRVMILGIPNVGKSCLINKLAKKSSAEVANRPGVTKAKQWIRLEDKLELLDTPGVLWPKLGSQKVALHLSFTGTIKDEILETTEIAYYLVKYLLENEREKLQERYDLTTEQIDNILAQEQPENENIYEVLLEIGKKRGAILSGGQIDEEKASKLILDDFRSGRIGRISVEKVKKES